MAKACPKCGTALQRAADGTTIICPGCGAKFGIKKKTPEQAPMGDSPAPTVGMSFQRSPQNTEDVRSNKQESSYTNPGYDEDAPVERTLRDYGEDYEGAEENNLLNTYQDADTDDEEEVLPPVMQKAQKKPQPQQKKTQQTQKKPQQAQQGKGAPAQKKPVSKQEKKGKPAVRGGFQDDSTGNFFHDFFLSTGGSGMSVLKWILADILMLIPFVNIVLIVLWGFVQPKGKNPAGRTWARHIALLSLIMIILFFVLGGALLSKLSKYIPFRIGG